jgi:branched-chain amino acid transport system ATP-binding protein
MTTLLSVEALNAGYGSLTVLRDVSITVAAGEVIAIVGANGAGKTTLLSTIAGLVPPQQGKVRFDGQDLGGLGADRIVQRGLALVPEGGRLFPFLTVLENLELGAFAPHARAGATKALEEVLAQFPILAQRRGQLAGKLSGGERQMCAIARAMMSGPRLLILDEPSAGLSPLMVERVFDLIQRLVRERTITVLLVEQNVTEALEIAGRAYVLERGRIVKEGPAAQLRQDAEVREAYMGI